ncbi:hypothetical protein [Crateriforma conspicua]|uniref:hypothetical protein n=1 Tax=Crateriforma conspicua TaxID=2527996 RepID=UPI0018C891B9|nr:hypothetical protein [Crateriforma conspicua]
MLDRVLAKVDFPLVSGDVVLRIGRVTMVEPDVGWVPRVTAADDEDRIGRSEMTRSDTMTGRPTGVDEMTWPCSGGATGPWTMICWAVDKLGSNATMIANAHAWPDAGIRRDRRPIFVCGHGRGDKPDERVISLGRIGTAA